MRDDNLALREHVLFLLRGGGAHLDFKAAISDFPAELRGVKPSGWPQTAWRLLEHMRIAQWDILEFCRNPEYVALNFPSDYWPKDDSPPDGKVWDRSIRSFNADFVTTQEMVANPSIDLFTPIPHGEGQTILREALLIVDHNSYHLGQLVTLRRLLGAWPDE